MTEPWNPTQSDAPGIWDGGWGWNREAQERACLAATPAQRLAWLVEAIDFAGEAIVKAREAPLPDGDR